MQVWTLASGKTAKIASGKPLSPSTTAIRMSSTPRFLSSFITRSQTFAPVVGQNSPPDCFVTPPTLLDPETRDLLGAVGAHAKGTVDRLVSDEAFVTDLHAEGVEENQRIDGIERAGRAQDAISSRTASVTALIRSGETSIP